MGMKLPPDLEADILRRCASVGPAVGLPGGTLAPPAPTARGVHRQPGEMNKTERAYSEALEDRKAAGEIASWQFDAVKLRLAAKTFYTPDFLVMLADGSIEFHEVKGHWEDDARVKIKVAARLFPFRFLAVRKVKGGWQEEEIKS